MPPALQRVALLTFLLTRLEAAEGADRRKFTRILSSNTTENERKRELLYFEMRSLKQVLTKAKTINSPSGLKHYLITNFKASKIEPYTFQILLDIDIQLTDFIHLCVLQQQ